jgi:hypothetical protein
LKDFEDVAKFVGQSKPTLNFVALEALPLLRAVTDIINFSGPSRLINSGEV